MAYNTIDICGKRLPEYLVDALSLFERGNSVVYLRGIGADAAKAVQLAAILQKKFGAEINAEEVRVNTFKIEKDGAISNEDASETSYVKIGMRWKKKEKPKIDRKYFDMPDMFLEYPLYSLFFDGLLDEGQIEITDIDGNSLLRIYRNMVGEDEYTLESDDEYHLNALTEAFYRSGVLMPQNWKEIAGKLSSYDDIILGVDTNILINVDISEHIIPSLIALNPKSYAYTPNWILFVIPSTAMHEIEEWANNRNEYGLLKERGRKGFRAIQEIISLTNSADISGISLVISGETDPVIDTKIEIEGLRQDLQRAIKDITQMMMTEYDVEVKFSPKRSTGDMIIRDQFKAFLRGMNFHKGVYFITADKSNSALASAEGLNSIYLKIPTKNELSNRKKGLYYEISKPKNDEEIKLKTFVGKLIYELAVEFGTLKLHTSVGELKVQVDVKGEKIDRWIGKRLHIEGHEEYMAKMKLGFEYKKLSKIIEEIG